MIIIKTFRDILELKGKGLEYLLKDNKIIAAYYNGKSIPEDQIPNALRHAKLINSLKTRHKDKAI